MDGIDLPDAAPPFVAYVVDLTFLFSPLPLTIWHGVEVHEIQPLIEVADMPCPVEGWDREAVVQLGYALREPVSHMIVVFYLLVVADRSGTVKLQTTSD